MRLRVLYVSAWLVFTTSATGIGILAVSTVGNVLRGAGPLGEQFSATAHEHELPGATMPRVVALVHPAAELTARCEQRSASLLAVRPAPGVLIGESDLGPDEDVHVELDVAGISVRLEVYCNNDVPRLVVE